MSSTPLRVAALLAASAALGALAGTVILTIHEARITRGARRG